MRTGSLTKAEKRKGAALTRQEAEAICASAVYISVPDNLVRNLDPSRGYSDIDRTKCWEAWLSYRSHERIRTA